MCGSSSAVVSSICTLKVRAEVVCSPLLQLRAARSSCAFLLPHVCGPPPSTDPSACDGGPPPLMAPRGHESSRWWIRPGSFAEFCFLSPSARARLCASTTTRRATELLTFTSSWTGECVFVCGDINVCLRARACVWGNNGVRSSAFPCLVVFKFVLLQVYLHIFFVYTKLSKS